MEKNLLKDRYFLPYAHKNIGFIIYKFLTNEKEEIIGIVRVFVQAEEMILRFYFSVEVSIADVNQQLSNIEKIIAEMVIFEHFLIPLDQQNKCIFDGRAHI